MKIDVLGTKYTLTTVKMGADLFMLENNLDGYCDTGMKQIKVLDFTTVPSCADHPEHVLVELKQNVIRHELIHAFLFESGLSANTITADGAAWATNEEMVDWFAMQMPKLLKAFQAAGAV